jgi:purine nucleoside phosphorylase
MTEAAARERLARFRAHAAVVYGSGLQALPPGARVEDELAYPELGWPCTAVPGHASVVRLVSGVAAGKARLRLALACGRPHLYEGWSDDELQRPVRDLAAAGVRRVVLTNSTGSLRQDVEPGDIVVCGDVVDLQAPPAEAAPPRLEVCPPEAAVAVAASLVTAGERGATIAGVHTGTYVAVAGPQFETRAEVACLAVYGDVVGMSAAPEVRAVLAAGAECCLLALVANRAAEVGSHEEVLSGGAGAARGLSAGLGAAVAARWPGLIRP